MAFSLLLIFWGYIMRLFKRFWTNISFRNWTFEGRKIANPFLIIWRLIVFVPLQILTLLLAVIFFIALESDTAKDIINQYSLFNID